MRKPAWVLKEFAEEQEKDGKLSCIYLQKLV